MSQGEQLSMDFLASSSPSDFDETTKDTEVLDVADVADEENSLVCYEPLDIQLAHLMLELNTENKNLENKAIDENKILEHCTQEISKLTREGQIAIRCTRDQQEKLLSTKVVGKAGSEIGNEKPLILDNGYLYLRRYWLYQQKLAQEIQSRMGQHELELSSDQINWQKMRLHHYFEQDSDSRQANKNDETNWQQRAAERALQNKFLIISGGPGTGKTTTIARILALLIEDYLIKTAKIVKKGGGGYNATSFNILLAAPTGKASIRMLDSIREAQQKMQLSDEIQEYIPTKASTIHKLLGYIPDSITFKHNRNNTLRADVVLVDEASMIDIALMSKLLEAIPKKAKIILIGDKDQLSSVETGSVFADMCQGLKDSHYLVTLQKNWRFSQDSGIGQLAIAANQGDAKKLLRILHHPDQTECTLIPPTTLSTRQIPDELTSAWAMYFDIIKNPKATLTEIFNAFHHYRILCALRRGLNGSVTLSRRIENKLVKQGFITLRAGRKTGAGWYHGRPIMITQNSYDKGLFNGNTGITLIRDGQLKVYFPDGEEGAFKALAPIRLPAHETTWAMTIHKSQGSEFNQTSLILPHEVMPLLTRQLIYTGITRAKESVRIIASEAVLSAGIKTEAKQATQIETLLNSK